MLVASARVVCFDLGGVLVRICQTWAQACARANLPAPDAEWLATDAWLEARRAAGARYQSGQLDCAAYFSELARVSRGAFSAAQLERIHWAWTLEHYPGALELVRALNAQPGVVTACLSNTNHAHWQRLVGADGQNEYPAVAELRHQLASHLLGCSKPDPRIYALAYAKFCEALSREAGSEAGRSGPAATAAARLRPSDVLFFDDLAENVVAARRAGWTAFHVDPMADTVAQMRRQLASAGVGL